LIREKTGMAEIGRNSSGQVYAYTKDPRKLTTFLKTMLWISLGASVLSVLSDVMQMNLFVSGPLSSATAERNDLRQQVIAALYLAAFIVTGIAFLKWTYRANLNCRGFGARDMEFTPGWSIGFYFIPIMNLYRPYLAMREIWKVSHNPLAWEDEPGGPLLAWWWTLWLASTVLGQISFRLSMRAETIDSLQVATAASIISNLVDIPLDIIAISLVSAIFMKQEHLVEKNV
jgi:hypothetical protein